MLPKLELARVQASLAGWVVSKPAQCTSAAYTTEEVAAQQEQHKQLCRCKKTQCQQKQRDKALSQVQVKPGIVVHKGVVVFLRLQSSSSGSQSPLPCQVHNGTADARFRGFLHEQRPPDRAVKQRL
jgi:predicted transglutaminase-like cysteine proteinase